MPASLGLVVLPEALQGSLTNNSALGQVTLIVGSELGARARRADQQAQDVPQGQLMVRVSECWEKLGAAREQNSWISEPIRRGRNEAWLRADSGWCPPPLHAAEAITEKPLTHHRLLATRNWSQ
ncbi:hypothetical protein CLAIMM_12551, partial [Cladophialophora immunda]